MQKHLVVLFIVVAALGLAGVAGAQAPDPTDDTLPDPTETTVPTDPDGDSDEEVPTTTESTTTTSSTSTTSTTTTTTAPTTVPQPELAPDPPAYVAGLQQDACHPSYVGVCVPTDRGDVNCDDVPMKNIPVIGPDPYGLDGNNDGVACELESGSGSAATPVSTSTGAAPDKLAATGGSSEQRYLLALGLLVAGAVTTLASAALAPAIVVPRRGGFTVTKVNGSGDEIRMRVIGERRGRRGHH